MSDIPMTDRVFLSDAELTHAEASDPLQSKYKLMRRRQSTMAGNIFADPFEMFSCDVRDLAEGRTYRCKSRIGRAALRDAIENLTEKYEDHRVYVVGTVHGAADVTNTIAASGGDGTWTAAAGTVDEWTQLNAIRAAVILHFAMGAVTHLTADVINLLTYPAAGAQDIFGLLKLVNDLISTLQAHCADVVSHTVADTVNPPDHALLSNGNLLSTDDWYGEFVWDATSTDDTYSFDNVFTQTWRHSSVADSGAGRFVLTNVLPSLILIETEEIVHAPVADLAALKALPLDELDNNMMILCATLGQYRYSAASTATADDVGVITPTAAPAGVGRFLRTTPLLMPIMETGKVYVDGTLGSDTTGNGAINKPLATISAAITLAAAGNSLFIAAGTYTEAVAFSKTLNVFARGVTIVGAITITDVLYMEGAAITGNVDSGHNAMLRDVTINGTLDVTAARDLLYDNLSVVGAITLSSTGAMSGFMLTASSTLTSTGGAGVHNHIGSIAGALILSGGANITRLAGTSVTGAATYSGTAQCDLEGCNFLSTLDVDGNGAQVRLVNTDVAGLVTVDGAAGANTLTAQGGDLEGGLVADNGAVVSYTAAYAGNVTSDNAAYVTLLDVFWNTAPVFQADTNGGVNIAYTGLSRMLATGGALTGTPFLLAGGSITIDNVEFEHTGNTDIITMSAGAFSIRGGSLSGNRAAAMFVPGGGDFSAENCELENGNADDAIIAELALCPNVGLTDVTLDGVLDCTGVAVDATGVRLQHPGLSALIAASVTEMKRSQRFVGFLNAGDELHAQWTAPGGAIDENAGFGLVGGVAAGMPWPARTVGVIATDVGLAFTVTGTDAAGNVIAEVGATINGTVYTDAAFASITRFECASPGGNNIDLITGDGVFLGWDVLGVTHAAIDAGVLGPEVDAGLGAFDVETRVWVPTTLPAGGSYNVEVAV